MCTHNQQKFHLQNESGALVDLACEIVTESENGLL